MSVSKNNTNINNNCVKCRRMIVWNVNLIYNECNKSMNENCNRPNENRVNIEQEDKIIERNKNRKRKVNKPLPLMNKGQISQEKNDNIMRIFAINPNGLGLDSYEKIEQLKEAY